MKIRINGRPDEIADLMAAIWQRAGEKKAAQAEPHALAAEEAEEPEVCVTRAIGFVNEPEEPEEDEDEPERPTIGRAEGEQFGAERKYAARNPSPADAEGRGEPEEPEFDPETYAGAAEADTSRWTARRWLVELAKACP